MMILTRNENAVAFFIALAQYFKTNLYDKNDQNPVAASNAEGTVLYHIAHSHGPLGLKEILKTFKQCQNLPQFVLQPFFVTVLLALASSSRSCEDEVLSILRGGFNRAFTENERLGESAWLRSVSLHPVDVDRLMNLVLENW